VLVKAPFCLTVADPREPIFATACGANVVQRGGLDRLNADVRMVSGERPKVVRIAGCNDATTKANAGGHHKSIDGMA
jgi:hypothetical protein